MQAIIQASAAKAETDFSCSVCYEPFDGQYENIPLTQCEHIFHKECLQEYIESRIDELKL